MTSHVALIWLGDAHAVTPAPQNLQAWVERHLPESHASAWLLWDGRLGQPDPAVIQHALSLPGDVWHAGLRLGMGGLPGLVDFISPTWMLNRDPPPTITATSWRVRVLADQHYAAPGEIKVFNRAQPFAVMRWRVRRGPLLAAPLGAAQLANKRGRVAQKVITGCCWAIGRNSWRKGIVTFVTVPAYSLADDVAPFQPV